MSNDKKPSTTIKTPIGKSQASVKGIGQLSPKGNLPTKPDKKGN